MMTSASEPELPRRTATPGEGWIQTSLERRKSKCVCGEDFEALAKEHGVDTTRNRKSILSRATYLQGLARLQAEARGHKLVEPRFSVYGRKRDEWARFAAWARRWKVDEMPGVLVAVQLPRVYPIWRRMGAVASFGDMLRNFWQPLFDAAASRDADDAVYWILDKVRVLDTVDDESIEDAADLSGLPAADDWTSDKNPPYAYYLYYMHENLARLNAVFRQNT